MDQWCCKKCDLRSIPLLMQQHLQSVNPENVHLICIRTVEIWISWSKRSYCSISYTHSSVIQSKWYSQQKNQIENDARARDWWEDVKGGEGGGFVTVWRTAAYWYKSEPHNVESPMPTTLPHRTIDATCNHTLVQCIYINIDLNIRYKSEPHNVESPMPVDHTATPYY